MHVPLRSRHLARVVGSAQMVAPHE